MQAGSERAGNQPRKADRRYRSLLEVMDLVALHTHLDDLLPDLASCPRKTVEFDLFGLVLPRDGWTAAFLHTVQLPSADAPPSATRVESIAVPPLHERRLAVFRERHAPIVLHSLETGADYPEVVAELRNRGKHSACLLPLATALGPVGLLGFASSRVGAYDRADLALLQRVAGHVAVAVDNVRHHEEALAQKHRLEAERDHWRTLLEVNNAVVTNLDLASLLAAITPNLRRIVPHDFTNLVLTDEGGEKLWLVAVDPNLPAGIDKEELIATVPSIKPTSTPFAPALVLRKPLEVEPGQLSSFPELVRKNVDIANVRRLCFVTLVTPRRVLGGLALARHAPDPFAAEEMERAFQAAGQIAIALENALAFREIAALKDRLARENVYLEDEIRGAQDFEEIIGDSRALQHVLAQARSVATTDTTVLLLGETGTGKELIARAIHAMSTRRTRPLVTVNCAASPAGLLESEWFGYEKGAFTGALAQKIGRFELAH